MDECHESTQGGSAPGSWYTQPDGDVDDDGESVRCTWTKLIDLRYQFSGETVEKEKITMIYIPIDRNLPDLLTKSLPKPKIARLVKTLELRKLDKQSQSCVCTVQPLNVSKDAVDMGMACRCGPGTGGGAEKTPCIEYKGLRGPVRQRRTANVGVGPGARQSSECTRRPGLDGAVDESCECAPDDPVHTMEKW